MKKSKKIFFSLALLFFGILAYVAYDISSKTTYPTFKKQPMDEVRKDSIAVDSL